MSLIIHDIYIYVLPKANYHKVLWPDTRILYILYCLPPMAPPALPCHVQYALHDIMLDLSRRIGL